MQMRDSSGPLSRCTPSHPFTVLPRAYLQVAVLNVVGDEVDLILKDEIVLLLPLVFTAHFHTGLLYLLSLPSLPLSPWCRFFLLIDISAPIAALKACD